MPASSIAVRSVFKDIFPGGRRSYL